ncbi:MAG: (d)CMP kinase [bacterium]
MQSRREPVVAIDGPVGSGKSTVARLLADRLGFLYIDTGAMYRAAAWKALRADVDLNDYVAVGALIEQTQIELKRDGGMLRVHCDNKDVTEEIRHPSVSRATSFIADNPRVRRRLVALQQEMGCAGGVSMEGRDIGTVVFPDAEIKVYLDAKPEERARRRTEELRAKGINVTYEETLRDLLERDQRDRNRPVGALRVAEGATIIDSTRLSIEELVTRLEKLVRRLQVDDPSDRI